jgi:ubiquinone/menaquinone biosynthesis C-methylase UbiE
MYWDPTSLSEACLLIDTASNGDYNTYVQRAKYRAEMVEKIHQTKNEVVLDFGCGLGGVLHFVDASNKIGVDISNEMLKLAREIYPDAEYLITDGELIPVATDYVDTVYSLLVLQHISPKSIKEILKEMYRVLKYKGTAILLFSSFGENLDMELEISNGNTVKFSKEDVIEFCEEAGFYTKSVDFIPTGGSTAPDHGYHLYCGTV